MTAFDKAWGVVKGADSTGEDSPYGGPQKYSDRRTGKTTFKDRSGISEVFCYECTTHYKSKDGTPIGHTLKNCRKCGSPTSHDVPKGVESWLRNQKASDNNSMVDVYDPTGKASRRGD